MAQLLRLFGPPALVNQEGALTPLPLNRATWLLFYLASCSTWVTRDQLAFFLRPDVDRVTSRAYLRKLLTDARKYPWAADLEVERARVRWQIDTDVVHFHQAMREGRWLAAVELYRGPFLEGLEAADMPSYEVWLQSERNALAQDWWSASLSYAADLESSELHREAAVVAKEMLRHDPLAEDALKSYLLNAYLSGQRALALEVAEAFAEELEAELGGELTASTKDLLQAVETSKPLQRRVSERKYGRRQSDRERTTPEVLYGVAPEEAQFSELLTLLQTPGSRLLNVQTGEEDALLIVQRVSNVDVALRAVVALAENLLEQRHYARSAELLMLARNHPACDVQTKQRADRLWQHLIPRLTLQPQPG